MTISRRCGLFLFVVSSVVGQVITAPPQSRTSAAGASVSLSVTATGTGLVYQWQRNGELIAGAASPALTIPDMGPQHAGIYTVVVSSGTTSVSASAVLGLVTTTKVTGAASEVRANILHPSGNVYDQVLLQGAAAAITADAGQVTRISYIDLNDDIVQVEFAGAGTLTLQLDSATGPAAPLKYDQPTVSYMKGHARIVIAGADETTNASVFSVGRANAVNQALFRTDVAYDGLADIASVAIVGGNGRFGGLRTANASYFATRGITGVYAPGVQFTGPLFVGDLNAFDTATPVLIAGSTTDARITGGDLVQANSQSVQVSGLLQLRMADGSTSHGTTLPAQVPGGTLVQNGVNVTAQLTGPRPAAALYLAQLRPEAGAVTSGASGYATIVPQADGTALVSVSFSNLTSAQTSGHLKIGSDFVLNLPLSQVSSRAWTFAATGVYARADLVRALEEGRLTVGLDSVNYPSGELRGAFVSAAGSRTFTAPAAAPALATGALTSPSQTDAARFLTQATFGPTSATIAALTTRGISGWIDDQMTLPASSLLTALRADLAAFPNPPDPAPNAVQRYATSANFNAAWWKTVLTGPDQLRQRVAFALSEILVVGTGACDANFFVETKAKYYDLLVEGAFGNYRTLLENVSTSPTMGIWLSHIRNQKADPVKGTAPDENYAREVQQLFSIGLVQLQPDSTLLLDAAGQPIPTYNQATIAESAKVFTGWSFAIESADSTNLGAYLYSRDPFDRNPFPSTSSWINPMRAYNAFHDRTEKRLVSLQQVPLALATPTLLPANQTAEQDLRGLLDALFQHPNAGPFLCRQLIQRLVTSNPSPAYVYRVAQIFANDGAGVRGNLGAVVRAILTDYEGRSPAVLGNFGYGKIKEPLLRLAGFLRALNFAAPNGRFMDGFFNDPRNGFVGPGGFLANPSPQAPLGATTVFNFFSPAYGPPGALAAGGLLAPELEIHDSESAINIPNQFAELLYRDLSTFPQPASGGSPFLVADYSALLANAANSALLVDQLDLLFCAKQMTAGTRTVLTNALQAIATESALDRVKTALQIALNSPDAATQK